MTARFLAAWLAIPVLGLGAAFHPSVRRAGVAARSAAALAFGAVSLTLTALGATLLGVPWSLPALAAPPLAASMLLGRVWARRNAPPEVGALPSSSVRIVSALIAAAALLLLGWTFATAGATSIDFLFFWGVKAARFADSRSLNADLLRFPYFSHGVPDYPPLVPIVQAWGALAAGGLPWRGVPVTSLLWLAAALPLLRRLLQRRLGADPAAAVSAFWVAALAASLAFSVSGGNAEAPLVFFESVAAAALLVEQDGRESRFLPALMLAGAVLTKVEGAVAAVLLVSGAAVRDALERRPRVAARAAALLAPCAAAAGAWLLFQWRMNLPVGYRAHGAGFLAVRAGSLPTILAEVLRGLAAGTWWLAWAIPLVFLAAARPPLRRWLPAAALAAGLLAFLVFDYMHDADDPAQRIGWTTPRVSQPALSAVILAAGLVSFGSTQRRPG